MGIQARRDEMMRYLRQRSWRAAVLMVGCCVAAAGCDPSIPGVVDAEAAPPKPEKAQSAKADSAAAQAKRKFAEEIEAGLEKLAEIPSYTYTLRKQERVDGVLLKPQTLNTKIRHEPFSVYLRFTAPEEIEGKEAIYVEGQNDGHLIGHGVGLQGLLGRQKLDPRGSFAMMGNRNPITESGMKNLLTRLKKFLELEDFDEHFEIRLGKASQVDERPCHAFETHNIKRRDDMPLARSITTFDDKWGLPVRFQRYFWPGTGATEPILVEDYTYLKVNLDAKLTDKDFDPNNPDYDF
jgi:hypothetical protein